MAKTSAGLLMYRVREGELQVLLVHPGGPFWKNKDHGAWMIPKGEVTEEEDLLEAAKREFREETGFGAEGTFVPLGSVKHRSGKVVHAWAFEGDLDPNAIRSNVFKMEWPPKSGQQREFPEIDKAAFFSIEEAPRMMLPSEVPLLHTLRRVCREDAGRSGAKGRAD